jgi:hypothetical protein
VVDDDRVMDAVTDGEVDGKKVVDGMEVVVALLDSEKDMVVFNKVTSPAPSC